MTSFCTDPTQIKEAFNKGLITPEDYNAWLGSSGYKESLKKSLDNNEISATEFKIETEKASGLYWERDDQTKGVFRFVLKGANWQPIDLKQRKIQKARESQPLQTQQPKRVAVNNPYKKIDSMLDDLAKTTKAAKASIDKWPGKSIIKANESKPISQPVGNKRHAPGKASLDDVITLAETLVNKKLKQKGGK